METQEHQPEETPDTNIERVEGDVTVENGGNEKDDEQQNDSSDE